MNTWPYRWQDRPCALWSVLLQFPTHLLFFFPPVPGVAESQGASHRLQIPHLFPRNICRASCSPSRSYRLLFLGAGLTLVLILSHPRFSAGSSNSSCLPCTQAVCSGVFGALPIITALTTSRSPISMLLAMPLKNASDDSRYRTGPEADVTHPPLWC